MKFIVDHMLGDLARWLRFLGFDAEYPYPEPLSDQEIVLRSENEKRFILTRDVQLMKRKGANGLLIKSADLDRQLKEVMVALNLRIDEGRLFSRCSICNSELTVPGKEEIEARVPDGVKMRQTEFWKCPSCDKYYWKGSHWQGMMDRVRKISQD